MRWTRIANIREIVLFCHLLRPQVLLDRDRVVRATLDGAVVGNNDTGDALYDAHAGDDATSGDVGLRVQIVAGERRELHKGGTRIYQGCDTIPREHLLPRNVFLPGLG